jgi:3-oxoadipate enol-lactonase
VARLIAQHAQELAGKSPEEIQAFVLAKIFAPTTSSEVKAAAASFGQQQLEAGLVLTPEQNLAANKALENFDFRPALASITASTLVISGRHDPLNPPEEGELVASLIPGSTFVVLEHSGHVPNLEEPERLMALIEEFLRS